MLSKDLLNVRYERFGGKQNLALHITGYEFPVKSSQCGLVLKVPPQGARAQEIGAIFFKMGKPPLDVIVICESRRNRL